MVILSLMQNSFRRFFLLFIVSQFVESSIETNPFEYNESMGKSIEEQIFDTYQPIHEKLCDYGFTFSFGKYSYSFSFLDGTFSALLVIEENGHLSSKVIEEEFGEEYFPLHNDAYSGSFVKSVREAYKQRLLDLRENCFQKVLFVSKQANRISEKIKEIYGDSPDFPFSGETDKRDGVFRHPVTKKWYGILMNVRKNAFGEYPIGEFVDVFNVKIEETRLNEILNVPGVYPAYHMNKKKWVSLFLDESLSDELVLKFIAYSRASIETKK